MQSWIHVIEWRANVRPEVTALIDDRGAAYTYAEYPGRRGGPAGCVPDAIGADWGYPQTIATLGSAAPAGVRAAGLAAE